MKTCNDNDCFVCDIIRLDDGMTYTKMKLLEVSLALDVRADIVIFMWYDGTGALQSARQKRPITQQFIDDLLTRIADSKAQR